MPREDNMAQNVEFIFGLLVVGLVITVHYYLQLWRLKSRFSKCWMPFHFPIVGSGFTFIGRNLFETMEGMYKKCNSNIIMQIGSKTTYVTKDPEDIRRILNDPNCLSKSSFYDVIKIGFGESLLLASPEKWKYNRKCMAKCFNQKLLDSFVPQYYEKSNLLLEVLRKDKSSSLFDNFEKMTFDSFLVTTIGIEMNLLTSKDQRIIDIFSKAQEVVIERTVRPWEKNDFLYGLTPKGRNVLRLIDEVKAIIYKLVQEKLMFCDETKEDNFENVTKFKTVMDCMIELHKEGHFDEKHLVNEALLMIGAATDTSAGSMTFTCGLLGMHPDIQEKVYQEVIEVVGLDKSIEIHHLTKLKYTERVINETLRIFPPVPLFGRMTSGKIDLGDVTLEDKTDAVIYTFALHRDKNIYPNPLKFDPDRFLPEEVAKRPAGSFVPFSAGPRNCIGLRYSYLVMKTTIANIVRNFKISTEPKSVEEIKLVSSIVMTSPNLKCTFTPRH